MCWPSHQTRQTLRASGRDIRYCDISLRRWPVCIPLFWVCPQTPRFVKGFKSRKYLCFCPQIEPVKVSSVPGKSFRTFHDKYGIGEVELKWPSRVRMPESSRTTSGSFLHAKRFGHPEERQLWRSPCRSLSNNVTVICRTNWQERRQNLSFRMSDYRGDNQGPAPPHHHHLPLTGFHREILLDLDPAVQMEEGKSKID